MQIKCVKRVIFTLSILGCFFEPTNKAEASLSDISCEKTTPNRLLPLTLNSTLPVWESPDTRLPHFLTTQTGDLDLECVGPWPYQEAEKMNSILEELDNILIRCKERIPEELLDLFKSLEQKKIESITPEECKELKAAEFIYSDGINTFVSSNKTRLENSEEFQNYEKARQEYLTIADKYPHLIWEACNSGIVEDVYRALLRFSPIRLIPHVIPIIPHVIPIVVFEE